jgi:glycosyltransferase involved in cell wall biosynthesis
MAPPLRILIATVVHDPEDARIRHRQLPALVDAGHEVAYAAPFKAFGRTPPEGVWGIDLPRAQGRHRLSAVRTARALLASMSGTVDVILIHDPDLLLSVVMLPRRKATIIWDVHEDTASALHMRDWAPPGVRPLLSAGAVAAEQYAEINFRLLLAEHGYRDRFTRIHPVVPNSVRVPETEPADPGHDRLVYLGKLTRPRGGAELIELARRVPEVTVEIIGPAERDIEDELRAAADEGIVDWRGFMPNDQALGRLRGALAGVSLLHDEPNYTNSQPTKVIEYMSHGLPTITTPNRAPKELVEHAQCGAVVPFGDVDAAAAVVRRWRDDREERVRLGRRGYDFARTHLNWNVDARDFVRAIADARMLDLAKRDRVRATAKRVMGRGRGRTRV